MKTPLTKADCHLVARGVYQGVHIQKIVDNHLDLIDPVNDGDDIKALLNIQNDLVEKMVDEYGWAIKPQFFSSWAETGGQIDLVAKIGHDFPVEIISVGFHTGRFGRSEWEVDVNWRALGAVTLTITRLFSEMLEFAYRLAAQLENNASRNGGWQEWE